MKGYQYFKVNDDYQLEYVLVAHGDDEDTYMVGKLAAFQIQNLIVAYKERFDKDSFIKNLLLDNLLLVDIYNRAKKLHIDADVPACFYDYGAGAGERSQCHGGCKELFWRQDKRFYYGCR